MRRTLGLMAAAWVVIGARGAAQGHSHHPPSRQAAHASASGATPATREFMAAHDPMMGSMSLPYTGDPDVDFTSR